MKSFFLLSILFLFSFFVSISGNDQVPIKKSEKIMAAKWADSILSILTLEEKIGQLIMVDGYSAEKENLEQLISLVTTYHVGGVIFLKGYPHKQVIMTNKLQQISKVPLFIAMDAEWGVSMRLDSVISFPKQMTLGAIQEDELIYRMGVEIARQCKRLGVHINFAPVVDINNNPMNPVIHMRSFGETRELVVEKGIQYMNGLQDNRVMAVAKHFPGHGDTDKDSHKDLPEIRKSLDKLERNELYPFKKLIDNGVEGVMVAHLYVHAIDRDGKIPTSLSSKAINDLLINDFGFDGLVFTDALNMKGVADQYVSGEKEVKAMLAGNDILLFPENVEKAIEAIKIAIENNSITMEMIHHKVRKVLISKYLHDVQLNHPVSLENLINDLNNQNALLTKRKLVESAITLVKDENQIIPLRHLDKNKIGAICINPDYSSVFGKYLNYYAQVEILNLTSINFLSLQSELDTFCMDKDILIISLGKVSPYNVQTFNLEPLIMNFVNEISGRKKVILVNLGSPYALKYFENQKTILQVGQEEAVYEEFAAQAVFGGIPITGKSPVTVNSKISCGDGISIEKSIRLKYSIPEDAGLNSRSLAAIDTLVQKSISNEEFPGCQILIAKDNKVIYNRSFGYHTYEKNTMVGISDIYDVASLTKVAACLLPVMHLYENRNLSLYDTLGHFIPESSHFGYGSARVKDMLLHQAGFEPWIPFYKFLQDKSKNPDSFYFSKMMTDTFSIRISANMFTRKEVLDTIYKLIYATKINNPEVYNYSDLDFIFMKDITGKLLPIPYEDYLKSDFYSPMGMNNTGFNPYLWTSISRIPPTESDRYFRYEDIKGFVHDPAAALMGGIGGHAGLFSNINDLAKLFQMFLNEGEYGGETYFKASSIRQFARKQSNTSRRGLGFDKPEPDSFKSYSPTSRNTPASAYGHTGFTGTCVWADPENQLIYIFLSNRTWPDSENKKIIRNNTRSEIQKIIYDNLPE